MAEELRSAALLLPELSAEEVASAFSEHRDVRAAVEARPTPPLPRRVLDRIATRRDADHFLRRSVEPQIKARRAALGDRADGPPRLLVRVDEFPHVRAFDEPERFGTEAYERFHHLLGEAGVDYLIAVLPTPSSDPYDPEGAEARPLAADEVATLRRLDEEGVAIAVHGLDHRTTDARPRRHSELAGLTAAELRSRLDAADAILAGIGLRPRVFVPPFNRFSSAQYPVLAERYDVVCGGPETIMELGFQATPQWRGDAVYLPAYSPLYGRAREVLAAVRRLEELRPGLWVPVVLHWGWELEDDFVALRELIGEIAGLARPWRELLDAADRARAIGASVPAGAAGDR